MLNGAFPVRHLAVSSILIELKRCKLLPRWTSSRSVMDFIDGGFAEHRYLALCSTVYTLSQFYSFEEEKEAWVSHRSQSYAGSWRFVTLV